MRAAVALTVALALLWPASVAHGSERLSKREAIRVTGEVVERRYRADPYAVWPGGIHGCRRLSARWMRCRAFLRTYRDGSNNTRLHECRWFVFVVLRGGLLYYRVGATRCSPVQAR